jgi:hypothetical protein
MKENDSVKKKHKRQQVTSIQLSPQTRDMLKKLGRMDEDWEGLLNRMGKQFIPMDDDMDSQLEVISKKYGVNRKLLGTIGFGIIIMLEKYGILKQIQNPSTNKGITSIIAKFLKFHFKS